MQSRENSLVDFVFVVIQYLQIERRTTVMIYEFTSIQVGNNTYYPINQSKRYSSLIPSPKKKEEKNNSLILHGENKNSNMQSIYKIIIYRILVTAYYLAYTFINIQTCISTK